MIQAVADTSSLVALSAVGRTDLLRARFGEVAIPSAVFEEIVTDGGGWENASNVQSEIASGEWILKLHPTQSIAASDISLDIGERECLELALSFKIPCIFIDDRQARRRIRNRFPEIDIVGAPGLLLWAKSAGLIYEGQPILMQMVRARIRYGEPLLRSVIADLRENWDPSWGSLLASN